MATRAEVYAAIDSERDYQDRRWNASTTTSKGDHSIEEFVLYMEDYLAEAKHLMSREARQVSNPKALHIIRKVVAMGVNLMEQNGAPMRE